MKRSAYPDQKKREWVDVVSLERGAGNIRIYYECYCIVKSLSMTESASRLRLSFLSRFDGVERIHHVTWNLFHNLPAPTDKRVEHVLPLDDSDLLATRGPNSPA